MKDPRITSIQVQLNNSLLSELVEILAQKLNIWLEVDCGLEFVHTEIRFGVLHALEFTIWVDKNDKEDDKTLLDFMTGMIARTCSWPSDIEHITVRNPGDKWYEPRDQHTKIIDYGNTTTVEGALHVTTRTITTTVQGI